MNNAMSLIEKLKEKEQIIKILSKDIGLKLFTFYSQDSSLFLALILLVSNVYESIIKLQNSNIQENNLKDILKRSFKMVLQALYELGINNK